LGRVYEAWDPLLSRTVALKTLQFDLDVPSRVALDRMLLNEARAAANLNHAHIVTMFDAGLSAHGVYIAMERLHGKDMRQKLASGWRPTPAQAAHIVRRVADALAYAHARGVVHCDIKPGNIFLTRRDRPKVLDFGIARAAHASSLPSSETAIAGSPHYLAPEQLDGGKVDARTDIYALGVVLYEMLAGRKAFPGTTLEEIHAAVRAAKPVPLQVLQPDLAPELCAIVEQAINPDPARRPSSAAEFAKALRRWVAPEQVGETTMAGAGILATSHPAGSRATKTAWAGAALAAGAAVTLWAFFPAGEPPAPARAEGRVHIMPPPAARQSTSTPSEAAVQAETAPAASAAAAADAKLAADRPAPRAAAAARRRVAAGAPAPTAPAATGMVQIAVTPWGELEVDGRAAGTTPPLSRLTLTEGKHTITVRNADFPPYTATVNVNPDKAAVVRHRFGS
jgi:serine/threonine-protein kinase